MLQNTFIKVFDVMIRAGPLSKLCSSTKFTKIPTLAHELLVQSCPG